MSPIKFKRIPCKKEGLCLDGEGNSVRDCRDAPVYEDYALPLSENLCQGAIAEHEPRMNDPYKETYVQACHQLDETLADPFLTNEKGHIDLRFRSLATQLERMISSPDLFEGDNGRYLYQIDARVLEAYLAAFHFRAINGAEMPMSSEIIAATHMRMAKILADFDDGLYKNIATQVALRRTEIEIPTLLLRTKRPDCFVYPALFREDAGTTQSLNHDSYGIAHKAKTPIQVKTSDYRSKARGMYHDETIVAIHQHVVNLDHVDGETIVTVVSPKEQDEVEPFTDPYVEFDDPIRYVAWGAEKVNDQGDDFTGEYIQKIGGFRRDGLVDAIVKEAAGEKLTIEEMNMLNGASHYLMAALREKQQKQI